MNNVLVTYATLSGSTAEVAKTVGEQLASAGWRIRVAPLNSRPEVDHFDAVVLGGPMIMGWHRRSLRFLRRHRALWGDKPLAIFVTAMKLTTVEDPGLTGFPLVLDPGIMQAPSNSDSLSLRERYSLPSNYLKPILGGMKPAKPASAAVFGGRLLFGELPWWAIPIALVAAGGSAGDKRDWELIHSWADALPSALGLDSN